MRTAVALALALAISMATAVCDPLALLTTTHSDIGWSQSVPAVFAGRNLTVLLSDVHTMMVYGELFGVEVSLGRVSRVILSSGDRLDAISIDEEVSPDLDASEFSYEFGGYYVKAYAGALPYLQTHVVQGLRVFLHTVCLDRSPRLAISIRNGSPVKELEIGGLRAFVVAAGRLYLALALRNATANASVEGGTGGGTRIAVEALHPCVTLVGTARADLEELISFLYGMSIEYLYEELERSRYVYAEYVDMLPAVDLDAVQIKNLYYASLYSILNAFLYPEVYGRTALDDVAVYAMALNVYALSKADGLRSALARVLGRLRLETPFEMLVGLRVSEALGDRGRFAEICRTASAFRPGEGVIERMFLEGVLRMCGVEVGEGVAASLLARLKTEDLLALLELGLIDKNLVHNITVKELPAPTSCWLCLSYAQALRHAKPQLYELVDAMSSGGFGALCASYIVLRGLAGISVGGGALTLRPFIPMHIARVSLKIFVEGRTSVVNYLGWGDTVKSVRLNGVPIDAVSIPIEMVRDGSVIDVELARRALRLDVEVLDGGSPLKNLPIYLTVEDVGASYRIASTTDSRGRASFSIPARAFVTLAIEVPDAGVLQLRTWVGDEDTSITVDVSKVFNRLAGVEGALRALEKKILELETNVSLLAPGAGKGGEAVVADRAAIIFSVLALFSSVVALSLAIVEVRRRGV